MPYSNGVKAATNRQAVIELIAAAYRVLAAWEAGDLAGHVTSLGATARHWDDVLGLHVGRIRHDAHDSRERAQT